MNTTPKTKSTNSRGTRAKVENAVRISPDPHSQLNEAVKKDTFSETALEISDEHARMGDVLAVLVDRYNLKIEDIEEATDIVRSMGRAHPKYT